MYFSLAKATGRLQLRHPQDVHKLVWSFFPDVPPGERPFMFRFEREQGPRLHLVSEQPPVAPEGWSIQTKPYEPDLRVGDLLEFSLKVNPTVCCKERRNDAVGYYLQQYPNALEELGRNGLQQRALEVWLEQRAAMYGFSLEGHGFRVQQYERETFSRKKGEQRQELTHWFATLEGQLTVTDPSAFQKVLFQGIGKAKAFGGGLFLVKRALK